MELNGVKTATPKSAINDETIKAINKQYEGVYDGFSQVSHAVEHIVFSVVRGGVQMLICIHILGNATDGSYRFSESFFLKKYRIGKGAYNRAKKELKDKGYLVHTKNKEMFLDLQKIWDDYKELYDN